MPEPLLAVTDISLLERGNEALHAISFTQQPLQKVAIAGETGSGKSTLLQIIAGLVQPTGGEVQFEGKRVKGPTEVLVPGTPGVAYLSQQFELPRFLRVEQVLRYANKLPGSDAAALYEVCRITHLLERRTEHLSGGERQRVALAWRLLAAPRLLLLDEPFSNLDLGHKRLLKTVIEEVGDRLGITCTLISHDPHDTLPWADTLLVLRAGRLVQQGPSAQLYRQPTDEYTAALLGDYNLIGGAAQRALARQVGLKIPRGKQLLLRPEQLRLTTAGPGGVVGTVRQVRFLGSYAEAIVELLGSRLMVKTKVGEVGPGDEVGLDFGPQAAWFV